MSPFVIQSLVKIICNEMCPIGNTVWDFYTKLKAHVVDSIVKTLKNKIIFKTHH